MYLESPRLIIRDLDESMAESIQLNSLDADNRRFLPDEVFETPARALAALQYLIARYDDQEGPFVYAIFLKEGQQIGYIQLVKIQEGWEIGFQVSQAYRGLGYATEAVKAFLPAIMDQLGIPLVYGICLQANLGSRKVMEKCGFRLFYEGPGYYQGDRSPIGKYLFQGEKHEGKLPNHKS